MLYFCRSAFSGSKLQVQITTSELQPQTCITDTFLSAILCALSKTMYYVHRVPTVQYALKTIGRITLEMGGCKTQTRPDQSLNPKTLNSKPNADPITTTCVQSFIIAWSGLYFMLHPGNSELFRLYIALKEETLSFYTISMDI